MAARGAIVGRRVYNEALKQALVVLWESADRQALEGTDPESTTRN